MKAKVLLIPFVAVAMATTFASCSSSDDGNGSSSSFSTGDVAGGGNGPAVAYTSNDLKLKLEATARDLMDKINTADFQEIVDLAEYMDHNNISGANVNNWARSIVESLTNYTGSNVTGLYRASNFYGEFEAINGSWQKTGEANHLQFKLNFNGNSYVLLLTHSGNETPLKIAEDGHDDDSYGRRYDVHREYTIQVPANLHASLTKNGASMAELDVNTSFSQSGFNFNPQTDRAEANIKANVGQYAFNISRAVFNPQSNADLSVTFSKGDEKLITANATAAGKMGVRDGEIGLEDAGKANVKVNVLNGRIIVSGEITNAREFISFINEASDNKYDEAAYKKAIEEANNRRDVGIYADNSSASSATVKLYPFAEENRYGAAAPQRWSAQPVIVFPDGTQYGFEEYFDQQTFGNVIRKFQQLIQEFEGLVDDADSNIYPSYK